jgi:hypothetical protein
MRLAALVACALLLAGCSGGGGESAPEETATVAAPETVADLDNILQLRSDFEADAGKTRVVVLFSPT